MQSAKQIEKKLEMSHEYRKFSVPLETCNCDSNFKMQVFWSYQLASSQHLKVQASMEDHRLGATEKTVFEHLLGLLATLMDFEAGHDLEAKNTPTKRSL